MSTRTRPLPPYAAADLLAVVVLSAITLVGLTDSFAGIRWILVAVAGAPGSARVRPHGSDGSVRFPAPR